MMDIWFYDTETALIAAGRLAPPLVCLSWCDKTGSGLVKQADGAKLYREKLEDDNVIIAAHNGPFDDAVMWQHDPSLQKLIWEKYDKGLMLCTLTFCKLHFIATKEGFSFGNNYSLDAAMEHFLGVKIEGKKGPDVWRLRYHELINVAIEHWPDAAKAYAENDAIHGYNLVMTMLRAPKIFSTPLLDADHTVWPDTINQCRYAWALHVMGCWGIRTDPEKVAALDCQLSTEMDRLNKQLFATGYLKPKGDKFSKDMKVIKDRVSELYDGLPPRGEPTEKMKAKGVFIGNIKTDSKETLANIEHLCENIKWLVEREPLAKELSAFIPVLKQGTHWPINPKWNGLVDTGRTSCGKPNLQQLPRRHGVRQCFTQRKGNIWFGADYSFAELCGLAQVQYTQFGDNALRDVINADKYDPHVLMAANLAGINADEGQRRHKAKDKRFKELRTLAKACFHPDTEVLTKEGWKRIELLADGEEVMAAQPDDTTGKVRVMWQKPLQLTSRESPVGELVHLKNEGMDLRVTPDHRMLGFRQNGTHKVVMPEALNNCRAWKNAGVFEDGTEAPNEWLLRLAVATQADGNYNGQRIRFGFTKRRKIRRMHTLLGCTDYEVSTHSNGKNPAVTAFTVPAGISARVKGMLTPQKQLPWSWLGLDKASRDVVLEEVVCWDGSVHEKWTQGKYCSTDRQSVEVVQALATMSGRKTRLTDHADSRGNRKVLYSLSIKDHARSRGGNLQVERVPYTGKVVCLSVPSTFIIARDGGVPVVVGQCNFGYPGGLGHKTFVDFAKGSYGVILTQDEAKALKNDWLNTYPEMRAYFEWIGSLTAGGPTTIQQHWSGRVRGDVTFCNAANGFFQGIVADGAKIGLYLVVRACYNEPDSPLYGARINAFIHDEILGECPPEQGHDAATELEQLMLKGIRTSIPDVLCKAEPYISRIFDKDADTVRDKKTGRLLLWTPEVK